jgi:DNA primase
VLSGDAQEAKYVNSPETMLFTKGNILFGLHKSKRALIDRKSAIVLEGQLDLITAFEAGVQNVIAPQGTAFTERQARILKHYVEEVVLCFDSDTAGQKAAERSLAALLDANLYVRIAEMPEGHDPDSLIRTEGAEAFTARIAAARDFFDHQIERHVRTPEFGTPRGKLQFARKMAEFVALLTDPVLRDTVINQVSARLQIPAGDLRSMAKPQRRERRDEAEEPGDAGVPARKPSKTIALLCLLALSDAEARAWLLAQDWRTAAAQDADGDLLAVVLGAEFEPGDANSVNSLLAGLPAETEAALSQALLEQLPPNPAAVAEECWHELERCGLRRRIDAITSRLRSPEVTEDEMLRLQKEVLDLQRRLTDIARPFS